MNIFSDPIAGPTPYSRWIVHALLSACSDALILGEAPLDNLVGRLALRLELRDKIIQGFLNFIIFQ